MARPLIGAGDPLADFFTLRRELFLQHQHELDPIGYKIGLELIVKCRCRRIEEIPIRFGSRQHGNSKLTAAVLWDYLRHIARLLTYRYSAWVTPLQFALVGAAGMLVDLLLLTVLLAALPFAAARALAIAAAMTVNFLLNRYWTFAEVRSASWPRQYALFCAGCGCGAAVNWGVSVWLTRAVPYFTRHVVLAAVVGVVAGFIVNYVLSRRLAFAQRKVPSPSLAPANRRRLAPQPETRSNDADSEAVEAPSCRTNDA